jgi:signal transduction histidine kinase
MTLQAEGASRIATDSDPRVAEALQTIKTAGHSALTDMRRMVGLLRAPESSTDLTPMPSLRQVEQLVQTVKDAGLDVKLEIRGRARALDDGIELSTYRIIQESLTNVARHGGPQATAHVSLSYGDNSIDVEIVDTGRGAASKPSEEGHGIIGMRERVAVLQGEFDAGPRPGGGFRVRARIPYKP